jgi:hypothetical protein
LSAAVGTAAIVNVVALVASFVIRRNDPQQDWSGRSD